MILTDYSETAFVVWAKKEGIFSSLFRTQLCHRLRHWIGQESRLSQYKLSKNTYLIVSFGEGNGTPLQYSCLENPMEGGAWWAAVHGVAKSRKRLSDFTFMHWRRKWQPTPVFLPGESHGGRSLVGCRPRGCKQSDMTEWLYFLYMCLSFVVRLSQHT